MPDKRGAPFDVRVFEPHDRAAIEAMYTEFEPKRAAQGLPPEGQAALRRWLDRTLPAGRHLVVEVAGRVLGHAMLVPVDDGTVELANFLHQSIRDRGIGTALNRIALDEARRAGLRRVWLSVEPSNRAAVRSYEKAGFRRLPGSLWAPEIEMEAKLEMSPGASPS
ncbi:MAG: GNAT family N-acetyltransferase [Longimicrobiales bacterium]